MCGISAVISKSAEREEILKKSLSKIVHRGSSNFEYKVLDGIALGTNRLPIVGRLSGEQPVYNEDETIFAILNGEIFNYREIREELKSKGHSFRSDSDTEVLVHLYEEYGDSMIEHLDSEMYAFVIYNTKTGDFYAGRDRFGVKPLYYGIDARDKSYHFASELKQLVQFDFITEVLDFPTGHYMKNGELKKYYEIKISNDIADEKEAIRNLTGYVVDAVKKRVDTDLPVAVLMSGGVDSSLVMEIANRFHPDVTAYILGRPGSSDYEAALKLCKEYNYKYKIVYPDVDYAAEIEQVVYHLELYEAQVIRQSFSLDILARAIVRDGYRIALAGEASDEIFGGYNEFVRLAEGDINKGCELITRSLCRSHNVRVDRMSMKHTLEVRSPFFDTKVVDYAMQINGNLKIHKKDHDVITKYIIRKVAEKFLPNYIAFRYKVPFSNGAGMNVGFNFRAQDGDVAKEVLNSKFGQLTISDEEKKEIGFITKEEEVYYAMYKDFSFNKLVDHKKRIVTKETLSQIDTDTKTTRIVVAEFDKMALYYPVYLAEKLELFSKRDLDVSFISTGGDDLTYNSIFSGSAQIGISDPVFSFSNNFSTKGKITASFINKIPIVAIAIDPKITITTKDDFKNYKIGSFQEFSTNNTLVRYYLPDIQIQVYPNKEIITALKHREIDIAFVTLDYAFSIQSLGGRIVHSLTEEIDQYLFTGFTISENLDPSFAPAIEKFNASIKEALVFIGNFPKESEEVFKTIFPDIFESKEFITTMKNFWHKKLDVIEAKEVSNAEKVWKTVHPNLLKKNSASFLKPSKAAEVIKNFTTLKNSREVPYLEDRMVNLVQHSIESKKPLEIFTFWGASDKDALSESDYLVLDKVKQLATNLKTEFSIDTKITFILTDRHAEMNGYSSRNYSKYLKLIQVEMTSRGFWFVLLSTLWKQIGLTEKKVNEYAVGLTDEKWSALRISRELEKMSSHRGHVDAKASAKKYYAFRMLENPLLEKKFANSIQISFSDDKFQEVYPDLPTLYLWPYKAGKVGNLPWFDYQKKEKTGILASFKKFLMDPIV